MALHKTMKAFLSPVLSQDIRHCFQQSHTMLPGIHWTKYNRLQQVTSKIQSLFPFQRHHHHFAIKRHKIGKYSELLDNPSVVCDSKVSNMASVFQHLPATSTRNMSFQHYASSGLARQTSARSRVLLSAGLKTPRMSLASSEDIVKRHKHNSSDIDDADEYREVPLLFRHKTKKTANASSVEGLGRMKKPGVVEVKRKIKKKPARVTKSDMLMCSAYATAEAYYLDTLKETLTRMGKFLPVKLPQDAEGALFMHLVEPQKDLWQDEPTDIIFFEEGTVVFWNATPALETEILWVLEYHQRNPYKNTTVHEENEQINYRHDEVDTHLSGKGIITLDKRHPEKLPLEKFAFSNAMMHSVKLAIWEDSLDSFVDSIEHIPDHMSLGKPISMSREEVMKKRGELFALRHRINLSSDLLIASDFYWDRDSLELLYQKMCQFYNISRRTKVMNEKLTHCSELVELMRTHLSEKHSTRLEWMIIALIAVEVVFEFIHYIKMFLVGGG